MNEAKHESELAFSLSTQLLQALHDINTDPNIGQAALGTAWIRICQALQFDKNLFKEMCEGLVEAYEPYKEPT